MCVRSQFCCVCAICSNLYHKRECVKCDSGRCDGIKFALSDQLRGGRTESPSGRVIATECNALQYKNIWDALKWLDCGVVDNRGSTVVTWNVLFFSISTFS